MSGTVSLKSVVWFATGVVLAVFATVLVTQAWQADAAAGDTDATYVPTSPCRLFDYRTAPNTVGPRSTPLGAGETYTQPVTGSNGNCIGALAIPADAVAVAMNVTAVGPTAKSNLRVFPADVATVPTVSNLNFVAGQQPVPNKVDVKLSPDGKIKLFNQNGTVSVFADVVGYYTKASLVDLETRVSALEAGSGAIQTQIGALDESQPFAVTAVNGGSTSVPSPAASVLDLSVTAPVAGQVTVNYSTYLQISGTGSQYATCAPFRSTDVPAGTVLITAPGVGIVSVFGGSTAMEDSISGTRTFDIAAGETVTYSLACSLSATSGSLYGRTMTAVFTPAP